MVQAELDTVLVTAALAGTGAYMAYMIKRRRDEIRKTIEVVKLSDTEFWEGLTELRHVIAPAKA
jgi:hypothetical protein